MKYCVMNARERFYFDTDYRVKIGAAEAPSINRIEIYTVDYDCNDEIFIAVHLKMDFHGAIAVTVHQNITFIEPGHDSIVLDIKRELVKSGIEVRDEL